MLTGENELKKYVNEYTYIFIYGINENSRILYRALRQHKIKVSCFIDDNITEKVYGKKVLPLRKLKKYCKDSIVLLDEISFLQDIKEKVEESGFVLEIVHRRFFWKLSAELMTALEKQTYIALKENAKKKILFISSDNNRLSGAFLCLAELNEILNNQYNIETLVILPCPGSGEEVLKEKKVKYAFVRSSDWTVAIDAPVNIKTKLIKAKNIIINVRAIIKLADLIRKEKFDLVHINTIYSYVGAEAALLTKTKFIWHIREVLKLSGYRKLWNEKQGYKLIKSADRVITVSKGVGEQYCELINQKNVQTVYDGVRKDIFYHPNKQIFNNESIVFLIVGGVQPFKGQKELVEACALAAKYGYTDINLWIVGGGNEEYIFEIRKIAEKNNLNVVFWGRQKEVRDFYQKADVFFNCTRFEAFGRVTVEAMLSGCLIVGTDTGATKEIVEDKKTGYLYHQGDVEDLAAKIIYILKHIDEAKRLAEAGRKYAVDHFTLEENAANIVKIYQQII